MDILNAQFPAPLLLSQDRELELWGQLEVGNSYYHSAWFMFHLFTSRRGNEERTSQATISKTEWRNQLGWRYEGWNQSSGDDIQEDSSEWLLSSVSSPREIQQTTDISGKLLEKISMI